MESSLDINELNYVTETITKVYKEFHHIVNIIKNRDTIKIGKINEFTSYNGVMIIRSDDSVNLYEYNTFYRLVNFAIMLIKSTDNVNNLNFKSESSHFYLRELFNQINNTFCDLINIELFNNGYFQIFYNIYRNSDRIKKDYQPTIYKLELW
jgi:hypothetical protein